MLQDVLYNKIPSLYMYMFVAVLLYKI